jgi:hypothetical protein
MAPTDPDFYVEDEPIEEVRAAYERGTKGVTAPPPDASRGAIKVGSVSNIVLDRIKYEFIKSGNQSQVTVES